MSTTIKSLAGAGCGCASPQAVQPDELAVVPAGSMIVQAPVSGACSPASSAGLAGIQEEQQGANCDIYKNPCVAASFQAVDTNKTGNLLATCASAWAMPGIRLFFPGLGYLEVIGVSGEVVTYKNLTIEGGTEIIAGVCFHHDAPGVSIIEDEGGEGDVWEEGSTLDAIYGEGGNSRKKIVPVDGMMIYACGEKWLRRQMGQMRYPITPVGIVSYNSSVVTKVWNVTLPNLPSIPSCSPGLGVELRVSLTSQSTASNAYPSLYVTANGESVVRAHAHPSFHYSSSSPVINLDRDKKDIEIKLNHNAITGRANVQVSVIAYHY